MTTDVRSAMRKALAAHLASRLASAWPGLVVSERWPTPGKALPKWAVTVVVPPGSLKDQRGVAGTIFHRPVIWSTTPTTGVNGTTIYSWGRTTFGIQIDAWAEFEETRDRLAKDTQEALHLNPAATVGAITVPQLDAGTSLVLTVADWYGALCDFDFDVVPDLSESSDIAQTGEWRATWQGKASIYLLSQKNVALQKTIIANLGINGGVPEAVQLYP